MSMHNFKHKSFVLLLIMCIILTVSCNKYIPDSNEDTYLSNVIIRVTFATIPNTIDISIPHLRYNKDFCLGLHLDDGAEDIYTHAFKFLNGGVIDGVNYPGLTCTDACGNDINLKMSTAIFSLDVEQANDLHDPKNLNNGIIKWPQIIEMYKSGWGVYNHGLTADPNIDHSYSISSNHNYIISKTINDIEGGINTKVFVNPEGDSTFTQYAFQQNYRIAFVSGYPFCNPYYNITNIWNKSNIKMGRTLLVPQVNLSNLVDNMAALSTNGAHYWSSTFSHSITNSNYGYSFEMFKNHMNYIANKYGKNGFDNIWMASEEEMLDFSILKDVLIINQSLDNNILEITFSGNIPNDLRFFNTSLILTSNTNITSIIIENASQSSSFNGVNTNASLININCDKL